ncbi:hypothetical protein A167_02784 [Alcanivorax sp. S71-1-4]|uniref:Zn-ribbon domain-containing OB-fold protein n=1 Tax=Alcanivorax sp. S71-1-4 TaxID=1177159 RepID=UPI001359C5A7|nr:OB-fold domain-containing protein [Alcanivorax sp. S71-1-4]KAF0807910.1 hypothetical protein A167_02784 [Alcanivorax sp. S71-1-4]
MTEHTTGIEIAWQQKLDGGEFVIQQCGECQRHVFFPREVCPHCGADALGWVAPAGLGTVYAVTTVRRAAEAGGDYNVSLIDLDEGVRLMSRVEGVDPADVTIGLRVKARVAKQDERGVLLFDRAEGDAP